MKSLMMAAALAMAATGAQAQSVTFGLGYTDYNEDAATNSALLSLEYQHRPFYEGRVMSLGVGAALESDGESDLFIGAGLAANWSLRNDWFVEASVMPGYYDAASSANRLGGDFQIRSLLGVGRVLPNGNAISVAAQHKSNASTNDFNPGVNALLVRYRLAF